MHLDTFLPSLFGHESTATGLHAPAPRRATGREVIALRAGGRAYAVEAVAVLEIRSHLDAWGTGAHYLHDQAHYRGRAVPVVDLRAEGERVGAVSGQPRTLVFTRMASGVIALGVDSASDVLCLDAAWEADSLATPHPWAREVHTRRTARGERRLHLLDPDALAEAIA